MTLPLTSTPRAAVTLSEAVNCIQTVNGVLWLSLVSDLRETERISPLGSIKKIFVVFSGDVRSQRKKLNLVFRVGAPQGTEEQLKVFS